MRLASETSCKDYLDRIYSILLFQPYVYNDISGILDALLLCHQIDVTISKKRLDKLFQDRFGPDVLYGSAIHNKEAISDGCGSENAWYCYKVVLNFK